MAAKKSSPVIYIRGKVTIIGEADDVKWTILIEQLIPVFVVLLFVGILLFVAPKTSFIPILYHYLRRLLQHFAIVSAVAISFQILLSE